MSFTISPTHLAAIASRTTPLMPELADWMNRICPTYEIDTAREYCHFLAQGCHETDHFKTLREYASGSAYEGRADLGNTQQQATNWTAIVMFGLFVAFTLYITKLAAAKTK